MFGCLMPKTFRGTNTQMQYQIDTLWRNYTEKPRVVDNKTLLHTDWKLFNKYY